MLRSFVALLALRSASCFSGGGFLSSSSFTASSRRQHQHQPQHQPQHQRQHQRHQPQHQRRGRATRMVFERFSGDAVAAVMFAQQESKRMAGKELEPEHLLLGVVSSPEGAYGALQRCRLASLPDVSRAVENYCFARAAEDDAKNAAASAGGDAANPLGLPKNLFGGGGGAPSADEAAKKKKADAPFSRKSQRLFPRALELSENFGSDVVRSEHLLMAVLEDDEGVAAVLGELRVNAEELQLEVASDAESGTGNAELVGAGPPKGKTPTLSECGVDLTELAKEGKLDPVAGRDDETARALQILVRRRKSNPCFIGEPGVGKTAIAEAIAMRIASGVSRRGKEKKRKRKTEQ